MFLLLNLIICNLFDFFFEPILLHSRVNVENNLNHEEIWWNCLAEADMKLSSHVKWYNCVYCIKNPHSAIQITLNNAGIKFMVLYQRFRFKKKIKAYEKKLKTLDEFNNYIHVFNWWSGITVESREKLKEDILSI